MPFFFFFGFSVEFSAARAKRFGFTAFAVLVAITAVSLLEEAFWAGGPALLLVCSTRADPAQYRRLIVGFAVLMAAVLSRWR